MEYITIREFAELANVSRQAVYKRIKQPELESYIKKIGNSILISQEALAFFEVESCKLEVDNIKPEVENCKQSVENIKLEYEKQVENCKLEIENYKKMVDNYKHEVESCKLEHQKEVENCKLEVESLKSQVEKMLDIQLRQLEQIKHMQLQLDEKDKLIAEQAKRMFDMNRLPMIVEQKLSFWQKLKWKLFKKEP